MNLFQYLTFPKDTMVVRYGSWDKDSIHYLKLYFLLIKRWRNANQIILSIIYKYINHSLMKRTCIHYTLIERFKYVYNQFSISHYGHLLWATVVPYVNT